MNLERVWLDYNSKFANDANWMKHTASPFGDPQTSDKAQNRFALGRGSGANEELHARWREARDRSSGFGDPEHPFRHRGGGKPYTFKLFLETAHALLKQPRPGTAETAAANDAAPREEGAAEAGTRTIGDAHPRRDARDRDAPGNDARGGRLGFLVPSGLYSDHGTGALRGLFLESCRWEWLFGVENRDQVFPIHRSYKFNPVVIEKGGTTRQFRTVFMRRNPDDWERADELAIPYTLAQIKQFSPKSRALLEIQSPRDLEILEKIYANSVLVGDDSPDGWRVQYAQGDFNMTSDSKLFPPRPQWEAKGFRPDEYSRWLLGDWRPIKELWEEMGVDPSRPEPAAIALEDWLFDDTADPTPIRPATSAAVRHPPSRMPGTRLSTGGRRTMSNAVRRSPSPRPAAAWAMGKPRTTSAAACRWSQPRRGHAGRSARDSCPATASSRATSPALTGTYVAPNRRTTASRFRARHFHRASCCRGTATRGSRRRTSLASRCPCTRAS